MQIALLSVLLATSPLPKIGPHQGLLASAGGDTLELVVGPERLALYALGADLSTLPLPAGSTVSVLCGARPALTLLPASDHFEAENPFGAASALTLAAVIQTPAGARAGRFLFTPAAASTFHDHRPYHGGLVGMIGERHLELAVAPLGNEAELQLYLTDAYRQPISLAGMRAKASIGGGPDLALTAAGGSFVARIPRHSLPLDIHTEVALAGEADPLTMDFYFPAAESQVAGTRPIEIRVSGSGFSPARVEAPVGGPVWLRFLRTSKTTCATKVVFPSLGLTRDLPLNKPVELKVTATKGELAFTCGMHMFKGAIVGL